jgi:hypothetical protein
MPTTSQSSLGQRLTDAFTDMLEHESIFLV